MYVIRFPRVFNYLISKMWICFDRFKYCVKFKTLVWTLTAIKCGRRKFRANTNAISFKLCEQNRIFSQNDSVLCEVFIWKFTLNGLLSGLKRLKHYLPLNQKRTYIHSVIQNGFSGFLFFPSASINDGAREFVSSVMLTVILI